MLEYNIYEVETSQITPHAVLKASDHTDRFFDYVIYDTNKKCHRADHIVKAHIKTTGSSLNADDMNADKLEAYIKEHKLIALTDGAKIETQSLSLMVDSNFLRP